MASSLLNLVLPPLPLDTFTLPPLPPIEDKALEKKVYTHTSYHALPRRGEERFEDEADNRDNEKLEHVGDSYLGCAVTALLHDLYPNLKEGHATLLKGHLVSNTTLAQLSRHYDLPSHLIAAPDALYNLKSGDKTVANLFEAYVAGVYYSYLKHGNTATRRVVPTPPQTPSKRRVIVDEDPDPPSPVVSPTLELPEHPSLSSASEEVRVKPTRGQAMDHLETWLRPLFTPLAAWVLQLIKVEYKRLEVSNAERGGESDLDEKAKGAMSRLNEWFIHKGKGMPEYQSSRSGSDMWTTQCIATDKEGKQWFGEATRSTKAKASTVAAYKVCLEFGLL
ncbi:hypothetical protein CI109_105498 [Kwoniella shandongensis]|uniref:RNase III domain-containing protein n=1 Tax=Kwoniella shandongensis TaxID=1734106 RepID=A0A5M6C2H8_9TREE|nr:uncharacterized protein CI109_002219 [Kwoniella shandongensis]KAA5529326.1 hypothetical protein CI109_002219 [Kwoniella shandongensis]